MQTTHKTSTTATAVATNKQGLRYVRAKKLGLTPETAHKLHNGKYSAAELRSQWDYRALGLKIAEARTALAEAASLTPTRRKERERARWETAPDEPY